MLNVIAYSLQIGVILGAGGLALRVLKLENPGWRLLCWQWLLAVCLILPLIEPWHPVAGNVSISVSTEINAAATGAKRTGMDVTWLAVAGMILASGALLRLGLFLLGLMRLNGYRRRSEDYGTSALAEQLGIRAEIRTSDETPGPVTFGLLRPVILVPTRWIENEAVLLHELIHVRRRDWLYMAVEELVRAVLWFHPVVWWAIAQIQLAREEVVDREVIQLTQSREQYLETLLAIAAARSGLDLAPAPLFLRKRHLRRRVASLMKEVQMSRIRLQFSLAGFAALALAAGWLAVRSFPLQAADETRSVVVEVRVQDKGAVKINLELDQDAKLQHATVIRGPEELAPTALEAVRKWQYKWQPGGQLEIIGGETGADGITGKVALSSEKQIKVGGNVQAANIVKKVTPKYPPEAKAARIQGQVRLSVIISKEGNVQDVQIIEGDPQLADAAVAAVRQWEYRPVLLNGEPVAVETTVDVNFTLAK